MHFLRAIKIARDRSWPKLWVETESLLVVQVFSKSNMMHWQLRNRWSSCTSAIERMSYFIPHIYKEENSCADYFANIGLI